jgi:hypothetical protein
MPGRDTFSEALMDIVVAFLLLTFILGGSAFLLLNEEVEG